jgi:flagellar motility protein MotE (MotC chaperone)
VPSIAIPLWLVLVAAAAPDPLSPPPPGSKPEVSVPELPIPPVARPTPAAARPSVPKSGKIPMPKNPSRPTAPSELKPEPKAKPEPRAKSNVRTNPAAAHVDVPEEEVVADWNKRAKSRRRSTRRAATPERAEVPERRPAWTVDRYAAVVPPGLTLAALRTQLAKTAGPEPSTEPHDTQSDSVADIEKAREALRQETARLEALLKTAGSCGGTGMPIGEPMSPLSPAAIREAPGEQIDAVSKAIKGMKPEQAAAMVGRLDRVLAAEILRRMKSSDAGAILGLLKPELAAELATQIATQKSSFGKDKKGSSK